MSEITFIQRVISDNSEIFDTIQKTIQAAESKIIIASSWFTDNQLFDLLIEKINQKIEVDIIIADNEENKKLDFDKINLLGGKCLMVKKNGFGIMHQKFCIVDNKIAIHGSYNYTNNARKNNQESVIYTNHQETVQSLIDNFEEIKISTLRNMANETIESKGELIEKIKEPNLNSITINTNKEEKRSREELEFERVLNYFIEAEINKFDRKELYDIGYRRSESCSGDHNTLPYSLDTLYYNFIQDIDLSEERKKFLLVKIKEHTAQASTQIETNLTSCENLIKIDSASKKETILRTIREMDLEIEKAEQQKNQIKEIDLKSCKEKIAEKEEVIKQLQQTVIPPFKWFDFVLPGFFALVGFVYLFIFYSSAAYILFFSKSELDAKKLKGLPISATEIFEPHAFAYACDISFTAIAIILFSSFIPIGLALSKRFIKIEWISIVGIVVFDLFIALVISNLIHDAKVFTNEIPDIALGVNILWSIQFWTVLFVGALPLFITKYAVEKIITLWEEKTTDFTKQKNEKEIEQKQQDIDALKIETDNLGREMNELQIKMMSCKKEKNDFQYQLETLPSNDARELDKIKNDCLQKKQYFDFISAMYISKVENDNARISLDALRDRITTFLEGWVDYLHSHFAINKAGEKSKEAHNTVNEWLNEKMSNNTIDSRLN